MKKTLLATLLPALCISYIFAEPHEGKDWKLVFYDDFNYDRAQLEATWVSDNGKNPHILSSRWPENVEIKDGILKLLNKKETRAGQDWTSGSIWTKKRYKYGYYECRYKYADATGVNNSFWIMTRNRNLPNGLKAFELDINEGHYPAEINCTIHNWSDFTTMPDGRKTHPMDHNNFDFSGIEKNESGLISVPLDAPVLMHKIRLSSEHFLHFHVREIQALAHNSLGGYPTLSDKGTFIGTDKIKNFALNAKVKTSGNYVLPQINTPVAQFKDEYAVDGKTWTSWVSQKEGKKFIEVEFDAPSSIGCVQVLTGWWKDGKYTDALPTYKLEYFDGKIWKTLKERSTENVYGKSAMFLSKTYNTYALRWSPTELIFYFNDKEIMRRKNEVAHYPAEVFLSAAITHWAHGVTDATAGTSMDVDYVKIWQTPEDNGEIFDESNAPQK